MTENDKKKTEESAEVEAEETANEAVTDTDTTQGDESAIESAEAKSETDEPEAGDGDGDAAESDDADAGDNDADATVASDEETAAEADADSAESDDEAESESDDEESETDVDDEGYTVANVIGVSSKRDEVTRSRGDDAGDHAHKEYEPDEVPGMGLAIIGVITVLFLATVAIGMNAFVRYVTQNRAAEVNYGVDDNILMTARTEAREVLQQSAVITVEGGAPEYRVPVEAGMDILEANDGLLAGHPLGDPSLVEGPTVPEGYGAVETAAIAPEPLQIPRSAIQLQLAQPPSAATQARAVEAEAAAAAAAQEAAAVAPSAQADAAAEGAAAAAIPEAPTEAAPTAAVEAAAAPAPAGVGEGVAPTEEDTNETAADGEVVEAAAASANTP